MIQAFGIGGYRSFGDELQYVGPLSKVNLLVGPNNSGKSNVLRFIVNHYKEACVASRQQTNWSFSELDRHQGTGTGKFSIAFGVPIDGEIHRALREHERIRSRLSDRTADVVDSLFRSSVLTSGTGVAWIRYHADTQGGPLGLADVQNLLDDNPLAADDWAHLLAGLNQRGGGDLSSQIPEVLQEILIPITKIPPVVDLIPAVRQIGQGGSQPTDFSGIGIIDRLAQLQNPPHQQQESKHVFGNINRFLKTVLGDETATLEIPYQRDTILVHQSGRTLPLTSLGTGVHEVVIIAAAATLLQKQVICLEEPEIHLHPALQRKLVRYFTQHTTNQYFITTHSASILDVEGVSVFHVRISGGSTQIAPAITPVERFSLCEDLGYKASDLLQTNCVIWVEGPSDRIYLQHWIAFADPALVEGIHYSIMFYGGRLLSHLTPADSSPVSDFISLRRLNRNVAIVMDSDRREPGQRMNKTKLRVKREIKAGSGLVWVTKGREIENYVDYATLKGAISAVHANAASVPKYGTYDRALHYRKKNGSVIARLDKVSVARAVSSRPATLDQLDLRIRVNEIVEYVHQANEGVLPPAD